MGICTAGQTYANDATLHGGAQLSSWYIGLIANSATLELDDDTDTMSSHAGWTEETGYSESTRPEWLESAAVSGITTGTATVTFTVNTANLQIAGLFVASNSTKGGTTGTLLGTELFSLVRYPTVGQVLEYSITIKGARR